MEFINVFEDSYPLYELCKAEGWTSCEDYEEFYQSGGELQFFEGDPDMIKIDGEVGYFCKCGDTVYYWFDEWFHHNALVVLEKFFDTYKTGITIGGVGYACGENPEGVKDVYGGSKDPQGRYIWDIWEQMETGIAFRGGGGYTYWISDWSEWADANLTNGTTVDLTTIKK